MVYSMCSTPCPAVLRNWIEREEAGEKERNSEDKANADDVKSVFHSHEACGMKTADLEGNAYSSEICEENTEWRE